MRYGMSLAAVVCLYALADGSATLAETTPLGAEFRINAYTSDAQSRPFVDMNVDGSFVVVWESTGQDGSAAGVFARRLNGAGAALGAELQVNSYTPNGQVNAAVATFGGGFVVAWESLGQESPVTGVFARRFSTSGAGLGVELQVNVFTTGQQRSTVVAADGSGNFVVAWQSENQDGSGYGVFARRFNAAGVALGGEFQVNAYTLGEQSRPAIAMDGTGDFIVVWQSNLAGDTGFDVFARRFDAGGVGGGEFQVNQSTVYSQRYPAVGMDADGDFVVSWSTFDTENFGIAARRYDSSGIGGGEFPVSTYILGNQNFSTVDMESEGSFVIAWNSDAQDGSGNGVFARRFDPAGDAVAGEFQVNTYTGAAQQLPGVAINSGSFVVVWESVGQDGALAGIFGQRFATAILDIDGNGATTPLTDGLLVLRFLFGFSGATLTSGAVDVAGCARCTGPAIEAYLETLI